MLFKKFLSQEANHTEEIRFLRGVVAGTVLVALVCAGAMVKLIGSERVVVTPPEIKRSFWVSGDSVSEEYLLEMAYWYAGLALNITPGASTYHKDLFLKYAAPSEYGRLEAEMGARAEWLKKNNASTQFAVRTYTPDKDNLRVAMTGTLYTWTSDKKAGERNTTYMVGFQYLNGRLYVSDFKETSDQNPFGTPADSQP